MPHAGRRIRCLPYTETVMCSRRSCHSDHVKHHSRGLASGKELKDNVYRCHCQVKSAKTTPDKLDGRFCSGSPRSQLILQDPDVGRVILPQSRRITTGGARGSVEASARRSLNDTIMNQLRRVGSPANFALFRQLASLQTSAQPCHDAVVQRTANAAGKEQPTAKSQPRGWLASVATCGAAAGVYAFNSEDVPLTGRRQLLFRWPHSPNAQPNTTTSVPKSMVSYNHHLAGDEHSPLQQQALQLVKKLYQQASYGTQILAHHHPELQQRLSSLPKAVRLIYNAYDLSPQASFQTESHLSWYKLLRPTSGGGLFKVSVNSGLLLQHASAEELVFIMGHELGHGIAKHVEEKESWKVLIRGAVFGRLALSGISGWAWLLAIPAGYIISHVACKWVPVYLFSQQHEHEADVLGAAIARAAGNSIEDSVTALARLHLDALLASEDMYARSGNSQHQADALASLQKLFPEVQLPEDEIEDSQGLTAFVMSMQPHLDSATDEEHVHAQLQILRLAFCVAIRRYCFHNDFQAMTSTHPCWTDRVAYLKSSSTLERLASVNAAAYPQVAANHLDLAKRLEAYQASPVWPVLVDFMERTLPGSADNYHKCKSIRSRSQQSILLEVAEQSRKSYNFFAHAFGWVFSTVDHARK